MTEIASCTITYCPVTLDPNNCPDWRFLQISVASMSFQQLILMSKNPKNEDTDIEEEDKSMAIQGEAVDAAALPLTVEAKD